VRRGAAGGLLGDQDPVAGDRPGSRDLIPHHYLGTIALADALDQGLPLGKLLGRVRWRLDCHGGRLAHANSLSAVQLGPSQLRIIAQVLRVTDRRRHEKAFCIYRCSRQNIYYLVIAAATSARTKIVTVAQGMKLAGCCGAVWTVELR